MYARVRTSARRNVWNGEGVQDIANICYSPYVWGDARSTSHRLERFGHTAILYSNKTVNERLPNFLNSQLDTR